MGNVQSDNDSREIRRKEIRDYIIQFRNPQGARVLLDQYGIAGNEIEELAEEIRQEAERIGMLSRRQFDIGTMRYLTLDEWIDEYLR